MADLHASAYLTMGATPAAYRDNILTAQYIANSVGADVINYSASKPKASAGDLTDGNSQLTLGYDWIATRFDALNVVLGYQGVPTPSGLPLPTDHFNGMTIARSERLGGVYRLVSPQNNYSQDATGDRTSVSLIAPGGNVEVADHGNTERIEQGSSFAAPHVTGTAVLLRQYAEERIMNAPSTQWGANARRHEVMKAVLMNSADKIEEGTAPPPGALPIPPGGLLGMERTVVMQDGTSTWFDSPAYDDGFEGQGQFFALDEQMGAGHLNANRALTQFRTGERNYDAGDVPLIGWDYGTTTDTGELNANRYQFEEELLGGSFISIMLAWDREVTFQTDTAPTDIYNSGDSFAPYVDDQIDPPDDDVINSLSLYLLPRGGALNQYIAASIMNVGTVDHIYFQIPETDEYEFLVIQDDTDLGNTQDYAVAWWAKSAVEPELNSDFNEDGMVDGADLAQWRGDFGETTGGGSDADNDGDSDGADFLAWQREFGMTSAIPANASVPEPSAWMLRAFALLLVRRRAA